MTMNERRLQRVEQQLRPSVDIAAILIRARKPDAPRPARPLPTKAELEAAAEDETADPLMRRIARARLQIKDYIDGPASTPGAT